MIVGISIVSTVLFDLPFREISKILTTYTDPVTEIVEGTTASQIGESEDGVTVDDEKNADIDEIWNDDSHKVSFADDDVYSKRSFTPVWKKSDDEKPVWGDEDEDDNDDAG